MERPLESFIAADSAVASATEHVQALTNRGS